MEIGVLTTLDLDWIRAVTRKRIEEILWESQVYSRKFRVEPGKEELRKSRGYYGPQTQSSDLFRFPGIGILKEMSTSWKSKTPESVRIQVSIRAAHAIQELKQSKPMTISELRR